MIKARTLDPEKIKKSYPNHWVVLEVVEEDALGSTRKAKVLYSSHDRDEAMKAALKYKNRYLAVTYTGAIPKEAAVILTIRMKHG